MHVLDTNLYRPCTIIQNPLIFQVFDWAYAIGGVPGLTSQTITGVVLATVLVVLFNKAGIMQKLREM